MFIWQVDRILAEIERQMPQLHQVLTAAASAWDTPEYDAVLRREWEAIDKVSIDFGIMEGAEDVAVIPARGLGWSDVGSWNAVYEVLPKSAEGNVFKCEENISRDTSNTLVYTDGEGERLIVTLGVENLMIIETSDVLLVCDMDHAQDVRAVVDQLREKSKNRYL
jgi:mannose-1-phosphate guanylyltransferase